MSVASPPRQSPPPVRRHSPPPGSRNQIAPFKRGRRPAFRRKPTGGRAGGGSFRPRKIPKGRLPTGLVHSTLRHLAPELIAELWPTRRGDNPSTNPPVPINTPETPGQPLGLTPGKNYKVQVIYDVFIKQESGEVVRLYPIPRVKTWSPVPGDITAPYRIFDFLVFERSRWVIDFGVPSNPKRQLFVGPPERLTSPFTGTGGGHWQEVEIIDFKILESPTSVPTIPPTIEFPFVPPVLIPVIPAGIIPFPLWKPIFLPSTPQTPPETLPKTPSTTTPGTPPRTPFAPPPATPEIPPEVEAPPQVFPPISPTTNPPPVPQPPHINNPVTTPSPPGIPSPATAPPVPGTIPGVENPFNPFAPPPDIPGITPIISPPNTDTREGRDRQRDIDRLDQISQRQFSPGGLTIPTSPSLSPCSGGGGSPCQRNLDSGIRRNQNLLNNQQSSMDDLYRLFSGGAQAADLALLTVINSKLGPQVPGGITGFLGRMSRRFKLPEVLNAIALIVALHNAAMLSKSLAVTLGNVVSQGLSLIGLKDEEGNAHDVNDIIGDAVENLMVSLLGEKVWNDTQETWKKANRVYQSAANILSSVQSMIDATRSITEWTGENLGKIGNALKRGGVVAENAYKWLPEQMSAANSRQRSLDNFRDGIGKLDDSVSAFGSVISEVKSIQEEVGELAQNKQKFEQDLKDLGAKDRDDNEPTAENFNDLKNINQSASYERKDLYNAQEES